MPPCPSELAPVVGPGDVVFIRGSGNRLLELGTAGGFLGHVQVVIAPAERLSPASAEVKELVAEGVLDSSKLPAGEALWKIRTIESTRSHIGLHTSDLILRESCQGQFRLLCELSAEQEVSLQEIYQLEDAPVELWRSPEAARALLRPDLLAEVLAEMRAAQQCWSFATAARAVLQGAELRQVDGVRPFQLLKDVKACWQQAPICTSIVVVFWQRYICRYARATRQSEIDLIMRWMPLKADRGLPGELLAVLRKCGWHTQVDPRRKSTR